MLRRRSLAALRAEVEPVTPVELARFLQGWQGVGGRLRGRDGLVRVVEQLSGAVLPASAVESLVLPARVADYTPALLDELMATGEVLWCGHGSLPGDDGWLSLHLADSAHVTLPGPDPDRVPSPEGLAVLDALAGGGGALLPHPVRPGRLDRRRGAGRHPVGPRLVGPGHRRHLRPGARPAVRWPHRPPPHPHRAAAHPVRRSPRAARRARVGTGPSRRSRPAPGRRRSPAAGRCCRRSTSTPPCAPTRPPSSSSTGTASSPAERRRPRTCRAASRPSTGCSARPRRPAGCAAATSSKGSGPRSSAPRVPSTGCGRDRATPAEPHPPPSSWPRATRPTRSGPPSAGPTAPSTPLPTREQPGADDGSTDRRRRHQPGRKAGAVVVLVDGELVLYVERGGRTLLTYADDPERAEVGRHRARRCRAPRQPGPHHRGEGRRRPAAGLGPPRGERPRGGRVPPHAPRPADPAVTSGARG